MIKEKELDLFLKKVSEKGSVMTLEPLKNLCGLMSDPQNGVPCVHIAGTNGKGSVLSMTCACLEEAGYRVGRFFSPQVFDDEPCACINGRPVDKTLRMSVMDEIITAYKAMEESGVETPTLFEIEVLCALICFSRAGCHIAVVECGMGGRDDATNIIDSNAVCVITSIGEDHMDYLGNTLTEIAANKAGIFREGCTVVTVPQTAEVTAETERQAKQKNCRLIHCGTADSITPQGLDGQEFEYKGRKYAIGLCGIHQTENAVAVIETLHALREKGFDISDEHISRGLAEAKWHGRFECVSRRPVIILDGAHNVPAAKALAQTIDDCLSGFRIVLLFGILADKQYEQVTELLAAKASEVVAFTPPNPRGLNGKKLAELCGRYVPATAAESLDEAVRLAVEKAYCGEKTAVIAAGSLYSLNRIRTALERLNILKKGGGLHTDEA